MIIEQKKWSPVDGWTVLSTATFTAPPQIVFVFGGDRKSVV